MKLERIFAELDQWIIEENQDARKESSALIKQCQFKLLGQAALLQSELQIDMNMTADLDAYTNAKYEVIQKLDQLLEPLGLKFDVLSSEIWMPEETEYQELYSGEYVYVEYARPEYLLIAKAKFAKEKNKNLLITYLTNSPSELFFTLAKKYKIDLSF